MLRARPGAPDITATTTDLARVAGAVWHKLGRDQWQTPTEAAGNRYRITTAAMRQPGERAGRYAESATATGLTWAKVHTGGGLALLPHDAAPTPGP